jgi:hypothetical protein
VHSPEARPLLCSQKLIVTAISKQIFGEKFQLDYDKKGIVSNVYVRHASSDLEEDVLAALTTK